jgi:hypothetical protein
MRLLTILPIMASAGVNFDEDFDADFGEQKLLHEDQGDNVGKDYYYGYVDYSYFDMMAYQDNLNYDYMSYDRYDVFRPHGD